MKNKDDVFFNTFVNEWVEIVQDFDVTTEFKIVDDKAQEVRMPMTVAGMVADADEYWLYLSQDGKEINQAIPRESIKHIGIIKQRNHFEDLLEDTDVPEGKDFN